MGSWLKELLAYMGARKKWLLTPVLIMLVLIGGLLILGHGMAIGPLVYMDF